MKQEYQTYYFTAGELTRRRGLSEMKIVCRPADVKQAFETVAFWLTVKNWQDVKALERARNCQTVVTMLSYLKDKKFISDYEVKY